MGKKFLFFLFAMVACYCSGNNIITVPQVQNSKIVLDGKITSQEWKHASLISPMLSMKNEALIMPFGEVYFLRDEEFLYILVKTVFQFGTDVAGEQSLKTLAKKHDSEVYNDDSIEIIISAKKNSPNFHQIVINSVGTIFDTLHSKNNRDFSWNLKGIKIANTVKGSTWISEIKLPLSQLGLKNKNSCYINICRNYARLKSNSTLNGGLYFDRNSFVKLQFAQNASPVKVYSPILEKGNITLKTFAKGTWKCQFLSQSGKKEVTQTKLSSNEKIIIKGSTGGILTSWIEDIAGKLLYQRSFRIKPQVVDPLPPADQIVKLGTNNRAQVRFYPGLNRMGINAFFDNEQGKFLTISCGNIIKTFTIQNNSLKAIFPLPNKAGKYKILFQLKDQKKQVLFSDTTLYEKRIFPWENLKLGLKDKPIKPFGYLKVNGNKISALTQSYQSGNLGLWQSVKVNDKELLASPITLTGIQKGKKLNFNGKFNGYLPAGNVDKITKSSATAGGIKLNVSSKYECDGFMYMTLELSADKTVELDNLTLNLPLKEDGIFLLHSVADRIRSNPTGKIPKGYGLVWNSNSVPKKQLDGMNFFPDGFTPYFWFGGRDKGLCFIANTNRGYALNSKNPMIKLYRQKGQIIAKISLIDQKIKINNQKRVLSFGLQATPVKKPVSYTTNLCAQNKNRIRGAKMFIMWVVPPALGYDSLFAFEPGMLEQWQLFNWFSSNIGNKNLSAKEKNIWRKKLEQHLLEVFSKQRADIRRVASQYMKKKSPERYQTDYMLNKFDEITRFAKNADCFLVYSDPRLVYTNSPEYPYFRSEWWCPQYVGYIKAARTFPAPSKIDRILYTGYQRLKNGANGIYYDDTFLNPIINRESDLESDVTKKGVTRTGILEMRELIKRTASMAQELKDEPFLMVHHTDAMLIPCFSFANLGLTWEMTFIEEDTQNRFQEDYIWTESSGIHAGLTTFVISGIKHYPSVRKDFSKWPIVLRQKTLSLLAVTLQHQIKTYGQWDIDQDSASAAAKAIYGFMEDNPQYQFIPYWNNDNKVLVSSEYKAGIYQGKNEALIIISSFNSTNKCKFTIDYKKLNLSFQSEIYDLVNQRVVKNNSLLNIPRNTFTMLYVGYKGKGKGILDRKESLALKLKAPLVLSKISKLPTVKKFQPRPNFVDKAPVALKYNANRNKDGSWTFTIDNTQGNTPVSMVCITDYPEIKVSSKDDIVIHYKHQNIIDPALNLFTFSGYKNSKKAYLIFPKMNLRTMQGKSILQNNANQFTTLQRLYVRVTANAGMKAQVVLETIEKRTHGE